MAAQRACSDAFRSLSFGHSAHAQEKPSRSASPILRPTAGFFIADKKGYFRAEGIEIKTTPFASAAGMVAPLGRGQLDVGGGTVAAGLYNAVEQGVQLRIVADKGSVTDKLEYSTLVVRKDLADSGRYKTPRRPQGHDDRGRLAGVGLGILGQRGAEKGRAEIQRREGRLYGFPADARRARSTRASTRRSTNEPTLTRGAARRRRRAGEPNCHLSRAADRGRALFRGLRAEAPAGRAEIPQGLYPRRARLQRRDRGNGKLAGPTRTRSSRS